MKRLLLLFLAAIFAQLASAKRQKQPPYTTHLDTLCMRSDSAVVRISTFFLDTLMAEKTAVCYPGTYRYDRFRFLRGIWRKTASCIYGIPDGTSTIYRRDGWKKVEEFQDGKLMATSYFAPGNVAATAEAYARGQGLSIGPCGRLSNRIMIIYGSGRRK